MRLLPAAIAIVLTAALARGTGASAQGNEVWISGGALPHPIRLAAADAEAFQQRLSPPIRLERPPPASGQAYTVGSQYWPQVRPGRAEVRPPADDDAVYYPEGGLVMTRQGTEDSWMVLDQRQQAILNRYIRLGESGSLGATPSIVEVLRADAESGGIVVVTVATRELTAQEGLRLLQSLKDVAPGRISDLAPAAHVLGYQGPAGTWITFSLPEGRSIRLGLDDAINSLVDYAAQEFYAVPNRWLQTVLGPDGNFPPGALRAEEVPQDEGTGSSMWWPLMLGGGVVLLAAAVFLQRKLAGPARA